MFSNLALQTFLSVHKEQHLVQDALLEHGLIDCKSRTSSIRAINKRKDPVAILKGLQSWEVEGVKCHRQPALLTCLCLFLTPRPAASLKSGERSPKMVVVQDPEEHLG